MGYKWQARECNPAGVPYAKIANTYLEKTDADGNVIASDTFLTQETTDQAWAQGYHVPGRPETRDVMPEGNKPKVALSEAKKRGRPKRKEFVDELLAESPHPPLLNDKES